MKNSLTRCRIVGPTRMDFEVFKSNVCHMVKAEGDLEFIVKILRSNIIREYWENQYYAECFYILAMVDYLSRENSLPICAEYADIRSCSLKKTVFPLDIDLETKINETSAWKKKCLQEAIPEFLQFNIVESEVRNVC